MSAPVYSNQQIFEIIRRGGMRDSLSAFSKYLLVVSPGDEISAKVGQWKAALRPDLPRNRSLHSQAHITVANLPLPYCLEGRFVEVLTAACGDVRPHNIPVRGTGCFRNGDGRNVIFLRVMEEEFFAALQARIRTALRAAGIKRRYSALPGKPHITLAKDLPDTALAYCQDRWRDKDYSNTFCAAELLILKRALRPYAKCEVIGKIAFCGSGAMLLRPAVNQSRLF